ncbi:MarR family transcriptional regulator [Pseudomonas sp. NIBR-H-19]|uniref:MarR family winged helix-turn-helix transcriptional regulator n=1 Tax=Pseudomonas sp. NIBR-H-19 TaxID=2901380 RepID=UPI001E3D6E1C|nr:MarR family transcriptional regulator [Pseudomonas sp. NIBR-H-19]UHC82757.1 MarR family transcriptional regulator [Pseudomonas sp. NIBR-H-19]
MNNNEYLANLLGAFATTISMRVEHEVSELGGHGLTHESALVAIFNHPNDSIDVLRKVLGITHSGAVRLINTLEQEGLVERHRSEKDARTAVLRVTPEGQQRACKVLQARAQVTTQILETLTTEQQQTLTLLLETALGQLTNDKDDARRICRLCNEKVCRARGCPVEMSVSN